MCIRDRLWGIPYNLISPFATLYMYTQGITDLQIGLILSITMVVPVSYTHLDSIAYMAIHGIPHTQLKRAAEFMQESRNKRNIRNVKMVEGINTRFSNDGLELDFEMDVQPLSMSHLGGSITERHLLFALAKKMCERFGRGQAVIDYLTDTMGIEVSEKLRGYLLDIANPFYEYDLLGALKSDLSSIYIDADEECIDVRDAVAFADSIGAISAYACLLYTSCRKLRLFSAHGHKCLRLWPDICLPD